MLIPFEAHLAQLCIWTEQAFIQISFDIFHPTTSTQGTLMRRESFLPTLKIFIDKHHRILELGTAHGTSYSHAWIFFVSGPYFKTFCV